MLESSLHDRCRAMERMGLRLAVALRLSYLGITECASHSHPLVAGRQTLVFQHPLAPIPLRPVGNTSFSSALDTNPAQLAQKRNLPDRFIQFHHCFRTELIQKGHLRTLFVSPCFSRTLLKQPKSREVCLLHQHPDRIFQESFQRFH